MKPLSRFCVMALLPIIILAGCGGGAGSDAASGGDNLAPVSGATPTSDAEISRLAFDMRSAFGADNVTAVSTALGHAGIAVYSDDMSQPRAIANASTRVLNTQARVLATEPGTGARMLKAQARGMALELSTGAGFTGALLNTLAPSLPLEDGTLVPVSQMLAAYIAHGDSYGARQSRALIPGLDPAKHLGTAFPTITIVFFMKEFVVPLLAAAQDPTAVNLGLVVRASVQASPRSLAVASDPCGAVSEFLDDLPSSVENAVQDLLDPGRSSGFLSFVSSVVGSIVQITTDRVKSLLRHTPFANALREVANVLGALTDMQSLFSQWTVNITPPGTLHKIPGSPDAGVFTLTMSNGGDGFEWPQAVSSCADLFGISLPQLDSADGSTVTWVQVSGFNDLGIGTGPAVGVIAGNKASYNVVSAAEGADLHNGGGAVGNGPLAVRADVQMPGVEQLAARIGSLAGSLGTGAAGVASSVAPHIGPSATGVAQVQFHTPASARINFDGGTERLIVSSPDGINPNGAWTGTFARNMDLLCGGWVEQPVSWTFANGTATLSVNLTFPGSAAFAVEACSFSFTETLTLQSSAQGPFMTTSGTWNSMFDPGWPGIDYPNDNPPYEIPPVVTPGLRNESYVIEMVGAPP